MKIDQIETILDPNESGELSIMMAEFKTHINIYLEELENSAVRSLADIIAFNENNAELVRSSTSSFKIHEIVYDICPDTSFVFLVSPEFYFLLIARTQIIH